ncbi:MAG: ribosome-recycling factor [Planctomycetota bacterium]|nr:MAG: ribosome-recycling factor [Planctomycetota bacterium]
MSVAAIESECKQRMAKAVDHLKQELKGVRTGRAHAGLVEHIRIEVPSYGSTMELKGLASISVPDPSTLLIKPFDPGTLKDIEKGLKSSDLGITPMSDGKTIRLPIPSLSGERRQQLAQTVRKLGEAQKIAVRNVRRDGNKAVEALEKAKTISEDESEAAQERIQKLLKQHEDEIDRVLAEKTKEIETV